VNAGEMAREVTARVASLARLQLALARGELEAAPELWPPMAKLSSSAALRAAWLAEVLEAETAFLLPK
jgi:hypothetical protein